MPHRFAQIAFTPAVADAQTRYGSREGNSRMERFGGPNDSLGPDETEFIASRDSFYLASVSETGWPYVQHRGGPTGFLRVLDEKTIAFADYRGNTQLITTGNLTKDDRVALFLMDYPRKTRLKILGHARVVDTASNPELASKLAVDGYKARVERLVVIDVEAYDWNCQQHITPRYTKEELKESLQPLLARIERLEKENAALRDGTALRS
jgi:predicted pyridoxine 5'-phosphate oxidase superfamily flavin-nucleotide-binding protein